MISFLAWLASSKIGRAVLGIAVIGFFIFGFRIWLVWHDAAVVKEATSRMVTKFERDVLASQLAKERERALEAALISEEYRKRADAAERGEAEAKAKLERDIAEDTDVDSPSWDSRDFEWLCKHGSKAPECRR